MHLETQTVPVPLDTMRQTEMITLPQLAPDEPVGVGLGPTAQPTAHNYPRLKAPSSCLQKVFCLNLFSILNSHHFFSIPSGISYQLPSLLLGNFFLAP